VRGDQLRPEAQDQGDGAGLSLRACKAGFLT
jgi:hypothetical protein